MEADCINYNGHIGNAGYGLDYDPATQKTILAHRLAYKQAFGPIPSGMVVKHTCNNKVCVNPAHLVAGTQSENVTEAYRDGLQVNPHRKLSKEQVLYAYNSTTSQRKVAAELGVSQPIIGKIRRGESYCELTGHGGSCGV